MSEGILTISPEQNVFSLYHKAGEILGNNRRIEEALTLLREGISKISPEQSVFSLYHKAGEILANNGRIEDALTLLREGISKISPEQSVFILYRSAGQILFHARRTAEAVAILREGLAIIPVRHGRHGLGEQLVLGLASMNRTDLLDEILARGGEWGIEEPQTSLARCLRFELTGNWTEALAAATASQQHTANYLLAAIHEALCQLALGHASEARAALVRVPNLHTFESGPGSAATWLSACIALVRGEPEAAGDFWTTYLGTARKDKTPPTAADLLGARGVEDGVVAHFLPVMPLPLTEALANVHVLRRNRPWERTPLVDGVDGRDDSELSPAHDTSDPAGVTGLDDRNASRGPSADRMRVSKARQLIRRLAGELQSIEARTKEEGPETGLQLLKRWKVRAVDDLRIAVSPDEADSLLVLGGDDLSHSDRSIDFDDYLNKEFFPFLSALDETLENHPESIFTSDASPTKASAAEFQDAGAAVKYEVVIVCALRDPELAAVLRAGSASWTEVTSRPEDPQTYHETIYKTAAGRPLRVVGAAPNQMGMPSAAVLATKMILRFSPRLVALVGIAAGSDSEKQGFGDVLAAEHTFDYGAGKVERQGNKLVFRPDHRPLRIEARLSSRLQEWAANRTALDAIYTAWPSERPPSALKVHVGPLASGAAVVNDAEPVEGVIEHWRKLIGLEMEAYAVHCACAQAVEPSPAFLCFKSIQDFATDKTNTWRYYAAYTSAEFLFRFITKEWEGLQLES